MKVSVIVTVYNEERSIGRLLHSLAIQTRPPDEIVICDGGSTDRTLSIVDAYRRAQESAGPVWHVLQQPGANISQGRNRAIAVANGPLIAATDAGVRLEPTWLESLLEPWEDKSGAADTPMAVAGFFLPDANGVFQTAMAATVLPLPHEIDPAKFLPSSRSVAFTKEIWTRVGGYPEWLDYCEDLLFDFRINQLCPASDSGFIFAPEAIVHFRPREGLGSFWRQYYRYARGDGKADLWRKRHALRYLVYGFLGPALIGHALFGGTARWTGWLGLMVGGATYCWRPWRRLAALDAHLPPHQQLQAALLVPVIRAVGDFAKMAGYPVGLIWRWRNRRRPEIWWRGDRGEQRAAVD